MDFERSLGGVPEQESRGRIYETVQELFNDYTRPSKDSGHGGQRFLRIFEKGLEGKPSKTELGTFYYEMTDDEGSFIDAQAHKATPYRFNLNVYKDHELLYYFYIDSSNVKDFRIAIQTKP